MKQSFVKCPKCNRPLPAGTYNRREPAQCAECGTRLSVRAFPALYRKDSQPVEAAAPARQEDASCFYHPTKKAEHICTDCGRFLCSLCALPLGEDTLCTSCLELRRKDEKGHEHKARRMRHDKLAMMLAALGLLSLLFFSFFALIPGGLALAGMFVAIRYRNKIPTFAPGYKSRMILAFILSLLVAIGSVAFTIFFFGELINA